MDVLEGGGNGATPADKTGRRSTEPYRRSLPQPSILDKLMDGCVLIVIL